MSEQIAILTPVPEPRAQTAPAAPARARTGGPIRLGLLSNGKPNTDHLLDGLAGELARSRAFEVVARFDKGTASRPAPPELLARLAQEADLVVCATGD